MKLTGNRPSHCTWISKMDLKHNHDKSVEPQKLSVGSSKPAPTTRKHESHLYLRSRNSGQLLPSRQTLIIEA